MTARRLRIAVVTPVFPTGAERYRGIYIYQTVRALQEWANVEVYCTSPRLPPVKFLQPRTFRYHPVDPDYSPPGVSTHYVKYPAFPVLSRPFNGRNIAKQLFPAISEFKPDLILAYWIYPESYAALRVGKKLGIPVIAGALGGDLRSVSDRLTRWMVRRTVRKAARILTVSEDLRRIALQMGAAQVRVQTIRNGCDPSIFHLGDRSLARKNLGVGEDERLVLFVGWLAQQKGLPELFEAIARLGASDPMVRLACIGEGPLGGRPLPPEIAGRVRMLGARTSDEVAGWLAACNLLCLPSHSEGCPNVIIEALACGRAVVASHVGGIPELVDSSCGILVPVGDIAGLTSALGEALQREWDEPAIARQMTRSWRDVGRETYAACAAAV